MDKIELEIYEVILEKDIISKNNHIFGLRSGESYIELKTRHYDPVENFMVNSLGAAASNRIGSTIYAICDDTKLLSLRTLNGDIVFISDTDSRFDENEEYIKERYNLTTEEFLTKVNTYFHRLNLQHNN